MLVYHKEPKGYMSFGSLRVYGRQYAYGTMGPTDVPKKIYDEYKRYFIDAEYTREWLERKYKHEFPDVKFTVDSLQRLKWNIMVRVAKGVGVEFAGRANVKPTVSERYALKKSILSYL